MTVLCWDGVTLAADRQISWGEDRDRMGEMTKIARSPKCGSLIGVTGDTAMAQAIIDWFVAGEDQEKPPLTKNEGVYATYLIVRSPQELEHHAPTGKLVLSNTKLAFGSGADYALGAMGAGASAEEAVRITCRYSAGCSGGPDALKLYTHRDDI